VLENDQDDDLEGGSEDSDLLDEEAVNNDLEKIS